MIITLEDVQIMKMELAHLESALIDARNEIDRERAINQDLRDQLQAMTWRALAAEGSNDAYMRQKFNNLGE
jgi:hypothetical protein